MSVTEILYNLLFMPLQMLFEAVYKFHSIPPFFLSIKKIQGEFCKNSSRIPKTFRQIPRSAILPYPLL